MVSLIPNFLVEERVKLILCLTWLDLECVWDTQFSILEDSHSWEDNNNGVLVYVFEQVSVDVEWHNEVNNNTKFELSIVWITLNAWNISQSDEPMLETSKICRNFRYMWTPIFKLILFIRMFYFHDYSIGWV